MKLVYLWIKNYKNIDEIGLPLNINYSEIMSVNYDYKKEILTINLTTTDYYNVFGESLNIQTLVGANGSGKSNLITALCSILRKDEQHDFEDYYDNSKPEKYCLIYEDENNHYKQISNCKKIDFYINNELTQLEVGESINCALFKPFLNIEDDSILSFPKDVHINEIINRKLKNYFYYDRFRMYDTSHTLKNLFRENGSKNFEIFNNGNEYLIFDYYGYEIDIAQEFEWLNRQLNIKIPQYFKKENIDFSSKFDLVDLLTESNNFIINKAKTEGYFNINYFVNNVISNGCFMFLLIKIADLFALLEGCENIITLKNLKYVIENITNFALNNKAQHNLCSLNAFDIKKKHKDLYTFYKKIQNEFNEKIQEKSIIEQFKNKDYLIYFSELINSLVKLENDLVSEHSCLFEILETKNGNLFRLKKLEYLNRVNDNKNTKENHLLNSIGIFRRSYYKKKTNTDYYSFYDLSTGEQRLLRFFSDILTLENNQVSVYIFDEMDLSWHPEWQRKMVYFIKDIFDKYNWRQRNIIFTTHSPFILSDMPINNVVLLYRDSKGVTNLFKNPKNSFCANIHDLFNDNFFFNNCNGLCTIEEFAQKYIKKIKKDILYYKDIFNDPLLVSEILFKNSDFHKKKKELYNKILLISEPVIRKSLLKELIDNDVSLQSKAQINKIILEYIELKNNYNTLKKEFDEKD